MYLFETIGRALARYLAAPGSHEVRVATFNPELLAKTLQKGDVLLVEGSSRISTAVKYLTQSTWSHAALCIADPAPSGQLAGRELLEADVIEGVRYADLHRYQDLHTRICRPIGLSSDEIDALIDYAVARVGYQYDLKNIVDLARYLIQTPPVPVRWRRRMLALGSGDPTKAICSSLIAMAFQSIRYPILPDSVIEKSNDPHCVDCYTEILHIRHYSLFAPRDFDISPYFQVIKPTIEQGFDPHHLIWDEETVAELRPGVELRQP